MYTQYVRSLFVMLLITTSALAAEKSVTPVQARTMVGQTITVTMTVKAAKDRLEKRGEIYLDSEEDFRDDKNFAVVITRAGAASLSAAGITNPADHFLGKSITASGTVREVDGVPRITIDDAQKIAAKP